MKMIKDLGKVYATKTSKRKEYRAIYECPRCLSHFNSISSSIDRGRTKTCGKCGKGKTHGMTSNPLYWVWNAMRQRCTNPNHKEYKNYGSRGITVCEEWMQGFEAFYRDMGDRPTDKHTLDRIDNNGNYEKSNCEWATQSVQNYNKGVGVRNTSGYVGVYYQKNRGTWMALIKVNKKIIYIGSYKTALEANISRDEYIIANNISQLLSSNR